MFKLDTTPVLQKHISPDEISRDRRSKYKYNRAVVKMSKMNAATAAGFPSSIIKKLTSSKSLALLSLDCHPEFNSLFEQKEFTHRKKVDEILSGMKATKIIVVPRSSGNGSETMEVPDHAMRHKYLDTSLKLCKHYETDEKNGQTYNTQNIYLSENFAERLKQAREQAHDELRMRYRDNPDEVVDIDVDTNTSTPTTSVSR